MRTLGVVLLAGVFAFAAAPIGTVSSGGPFQLRGNRVPVAGVPSWPVVVGDEIGTETSAATIQLGDGSVVTLDKSSRAQIEQQGSQVVFRLKSGTMQFKIAPRSTVRIINQNSLVQVQPGIVKTISTRPGPVTAVLPPPPPPPPDPISGR